MLATYPACFFKEKNGYFVIFPDLDLTTHGETLEQALAATIDCLAGCLYQFEQNGETGPKPSPMDEINLVDIAKKLGANVEGSFTNIITVDVAEYAKIHFKKSVRKNLTIPAWLNNAALEQNINFSQVLQEALVAKLKINRKL